MSEIGRMQTRSELECAARHFWRTEKGELITRRLDEYTLCWRANRRVNWFRWELREGGEFGDLVAVVNTTESSNCYHATILTRDSVHSGYKSFDKLIDAFQWASIEGLKVVRGVDSEICEVEPCLQPVSKVDLIEALRRARKELDLL